MFVSQQLRHQRTSACTWRLPPAASSCSPLPWSCARGASVGGCGKRTAELASERHCQPRPDSISVYLTYLATRSVNTKPLPAVGRALFGLESAIQLYVTVLTACACACDSEAAALRFLYSTNVCIASKWVVTQSPPRAVVLVEALRNALAVALLVLRLHRSDSSLITGHLLCEMSVFATATAVLMPVLLELCCDRHTAALQARVGLDAIGCPRALQRARDAFFSAVQRVSRAILFDEPALAHTSMGGIHIGFVALCSFGPLAGSPFHFTAEDIASFINVVAAASLVYAVTTKRRVGTCTELRELECRVGSGEVSHALQRVGLGTTTAQAARVAALRDALARAATDGEAGASPQVSSWLSNPSFLTRVPIHRPAAETAVCALHAALPAAIAISLALVEPSHATRSAGAPRVCVSSSHAASGVPPAVVRSLLPSTEDGWGGTAAAFACSGEARLAHSGANVAESLHACVRGIATFFQSRHRACVALTPASPTDDWPPAAAACSFSDWAAARGAGLPRGATLVTLPLGALPLGFVTLACPPGQLAVHGDRPGGGLWALRGWVGAGGAFVACDVMSCRHGAGPAYAPYAQWLQGWRRGGSARRPSARRTQPPLYRTSFRPTSSACWRAARNPRRLAVPRRCGRRPPPTAWSGCCVPTTALSRASLRMVRCPLPVRCPSLFWFLISRIVASGWVHGSRRRTVVRRLHGLARPPVQPV